MNRTVMRLSDRIVFTGSKTQVVDWSLKGNQSHINGIEHGFIIAPPLPGRSRLRKLINHSSFFASRKLCLFIWMYSEILWNSPSLIWNVHFNLFVVVQTTVESTRFGATIYLLCPDKDVLRRWTRTSCRPPFHPSIIENNEAYKTIHDVQHDLHPWRPRRFQGVFRNSHVMEFLTSDVDFIKKISCRSVGEMHMSTDGNFSGIKRCQKPGRRDPGIGIRDPVWINMSSQTAKFLNRCWPKIPCSSNYIFGPAITPYIQAWSTATLIKRAENQVGRSKSSWKPLGFKLSSMVA